MGSLTAVREIIYSVRDFLFPPVCPRCEGELQDEEVVCSSCVDSLYLEALRYTAPQRKVESASALSVLLPYDATCRSLVHSLKYHGMSSLGLVMGKLMAQKTLKQVTVSQTAVLVPVPLHPDRFRQRGYNQSERLASGFASFSGHEIRNDILKRARNTETQTRLSHEERKQNVDSAFIFAGETSLAGLDVVLIDDVLTTGSTMGECARALEAGGAGSIVVSVLASPDPGTE